MQNLRGTINPPINMRILSINKRLYTNKDALEDKYGRLYEIPLELSKLGINVDCVTISYRRKRDGLYAPENRKNPRWYSANLTPRSLFKLFRHILMLAEEKPDVIWAGSDVLHIAMGLYFSKRFRIPLFVDFYDNYRSFGLTKIPGANLLLKRACQYATGITVASKALQLLVTEHYSGESKISLIPNGVPRSLFRRHEKMASRKALKLPEGATLIGTAGSLDETRGIDALFQAFLSLAAEHANLYLVVAGPRKASRPWPHHPRIVDLGLIDFIDVPILYSALDVGVVCNISDDFGNYCAPMKVEEMIACELSTVAARTRSAELDLQDRGILLYEPENNEDLAIKILSLVASPAHSYNSIQRYWDQIAIDLCNELRTSVAR